MKNLFVKYNIALKLKELGFNEECFAEYNHSRALLIFYPQKDSYGYCGIESYTGTKDTIGILAPLYQQVITWFREKHNLFIDIDTDCTSTPKFCFYIYKYNKDLDWDVDIHNEYEFNLYRTHEEATKEAILKAIELIKK